MNAAVNAFFLILKLLSLYFLVVSLFSLCRRKMPAILRYAKAVCQC